MIRKIIYILISLLVLPVFIIKDIRVKLYEEYIKVGGVNDEAI